jgi:hypothetical protein
MNTGSVQDQLLAEQRAYCSALAPDYLDQGLGRVHEFLNRLDNCRPGRREGIGN